MCVLRNVILQTSTAIQSTSQPLLSLLSILNNYRVSQVSYLTLVTIIILSPNYNSLMWGLLAQCRTDVHEINLLV